MIDRLIEIDRKLFLFLNGMNSPVCDHIMWWASAKITWLPLYVVLVCVIIYKERPYDFIYTLIFAAIVVTLSDQISTFIRGNLGRLRPSHDPEIAHLVHIINDYRGGRFGFVSSHAANTFGAAVFLAKCFQNINWSLFLFSWAILVAYSRIYLGVHFPLDVICGGILGAVIGSKCYFIKIKTEKIIKKWRQRDNRK